MTRKWWLMVAGRFVLLLAISSLDPVLNENQGWQIDNSASSLANVFGFLPLITIVLAAWIGGRYALLTSAFTGAICTAAFWYLQVPYIRHADEQFVGDCMVNGMAVLVAGSLVTAIKFGKAKRRPKLPPEDPDYPADVWPPAPLKY